ncbi:MAG: hypothetical protein IT262_06175, partial [Saprospiraceae bacterium]|nr:hypothetical protein [Saprospiraceae bacterium]
MCGIAGYWQQQGTAGNGTLLDMSAWLAHRGPDDEGYWLWNQATRTGRSFRGTHSAEGLPGHLPNLSGTPDLLHHLAFGHRRFSIIDLSVAGHQPMQARDVVLLYNGEIYNFQALRSELESLGHTFSSRSDAEVVICAYRQWGTDCFARFRGFFALALF